jgi:NitT/TauT family transport system permease protein
VTAGLIWQLLVFLQVRPSYVLPPPSEVGVSLLTMLTDGHFLQAILTTISRASLGYLIAVVVGTLVGIAVSRFGLLRAAVGALITGLQTMPSIAWFPLAILLFGLTEQAIGFVIVVGAAPSIANGLISGVDDVDPALVKVGRSLGCHGLAIYRYVLLPASLPSYVAGLKQGWAFAWRSLMAGELLVVIAARPSLGVQLQFDREFANAPGLIATMIVILAIGVLVDGFFARLANGVRRQRGMRDVRS